MGGKERWVDLTEGPDFRTLKCATKYNRFAKFSREEKASCYGRATQRRMQYEERSQVSMFESVAKV
jgi:hypothetical protein